MQALFVTRKKMEEYYKEREQYVCIFFSLIKASQYIEYFGWNFWLLLFLFLDMIYMIKCIYGGIEVSTILRFFINKKETTVLYIN